MPDIPKITKRGQASQERRACMYCGNDANIKGIASHERACKRKKDDLQKTMEFLASQNQHLQDEDYSNALLDVKRAYAELTMASNSSANLNLETAANFVSPTETNPASNMDTSEDDQREHDIPLHPVLPSAAETHPASNMDTSEDVQREHDIPLHPVLPSAAEPAASSPISTGHPVDPITGERINDAIKIVYHPHSGRVEEVKSLDDYRYQHKVFAPTEEEPWLPFRTRGDYEYADIALAASLTAEQNNTLISLIHRFIRGDLKFTLFNNADLQRQWTLASSKLTRFKSKDFTVKYKNEERVFKVYYRPIWNWALDLLRDPRIVSQFNWDARKLYKYQENSDSFVRFYEEPWTADTFWDTQSSFTDESTKAFSIILYADKDKLSSFGTQKGYPVVARCANLPVSIQNSHGIGGGSIVGWLPIVPENSQDSGKTGFANFKTAVWHRAVEFIIRSIKKKSKVGRWVNCGDGVARHICPHILIISADHEEQNVIGLNRGSKGKKSCNICNHPSRVLSNVLVKYSLRTAKDSKDSYEVSKSFRTAKSRDFILKLNGLRPVKNAFWEIGHTDVHRALSWDRLHAYHSGLFANHIWPVFCNYFKELGRDTQVKVDERLRLFPTWRGLYHFDGALKITFNDGRKHEDLSKQLFYAIHDIFDRDKDNEGYLFTRLFRKFLELDAYFSFDLHTEETVTNTENELNCFGKLLLEYIDLTAETRDKDWNFIKAHSHLHACADIRAKGVTRNYNTKPNEKMHGPLRDIYHERTNFRNVAPQILKISHQLSVSTYIRSQLDIIDKRESVNLDFDIECEDAEIDRRSKPKRTPLLPPNDKYLLGAPQRPCTLAHLENTNKDDPAFKDFRKKLVGYMNYFFRSYKRPLPGNKYLRLAAEHEIVEFRYLKVNYESLVTWKIITDYLRCTPKFFNKPRYDFVFYDVDGSKKNFARLVLMFTIWIEAEAYPIALVQPLNAYLGPPRNRDLELGLYRFGIKPRSGAEFIPIASIIRGALVVPAFEDGRENEFLVMDLIDGDMMLRCQKLKS